MNYQKIYDDIVSKAKLENRKKFNGTYYERHHIIPRCMNGSNEDSNLVLLTAREHFICHKLLVEINPESKKLKFAYIALKMCNSKQKRDYIIGAREYERLKIMSSIIISERVVSRETREKMSRSRIGLECSKETKAKIRQTNLNHLVSVETRAKLSKSLTGRERTKESIRKQKEWRQENPMIFTKEIRQKIKNSKIGHGVSVEARSKISAANRGRVQTKEEKIKRSKSAKGVKKTEEHKLKLSISRLSQERVECPWCSMAGSRSNMTRYHFDNCKHKKVEVPV